MCKFQKPSLPQGATDDERRSIMFNALYSLDLNDKLEKRDDNDKLSYLSWANAWAEFKSAYPSATYRIIKNPSTNLPYFSDPNIGIIVYTEVSCDGVSHEMWLPVMNGANKAMKETPYTYQVWDSYKKQYVEKTVQAATMFDINKTIMRCLVKNLAMFGLGLYVYAGEDIPSTDEPNTEPATTKRQQTSIKPTHQKTQIPQQPTVNPHASLIEKINSTNDVAALVSIYLDNTQVIESNSELKTLLTNRKKALQTLNAA